MYVSQSSYKWQIKIGSLKLMLIKNIFYGTCLNIQKNH